MGSTLGSAELYLRWCLYSGQCQRSKPSDTGIILVRVKRPKVQQNTYAVSNVRCDWSLKQPRDSNSKCYALKTLLSKWATTDGYSFLFHVSTVGINL